MSNADDLLRGSINVEVPIEGGATVVASNAHVHVADAAELANLCDEFNIGPGGGGAAACICVVVVTLIIDVFILFCSVFMFSYIFPRHTICKILFVVYCT